MLIWLLLLSLAGSLAAGAVARIAGRGAGWVLSVLPAAVFASLIAIAPGIERGWVIAEGRRWAPALGLDFTLRLDGFSFLLSLLVTGIGALVIIYAGAYLNDRTPAERGRFFTLLLLFMTAMLGAVLADNLLLFLLFWEATSILSFLLVGFDSRSARARHSALMALHVTALGGLALLAAVILIGQSLGTWSMQEAVARAGELAAGPNGGAILACLMLAGFTKSAQFPFHFWLPNAMQAPTPASAYLHSATMVKLGIYLLSRFEPLAAAVPGGRPVLVTVGCATMLVAALQALRSEGFKTSLAYSTVASLGVLVTLIGLTGPAASVAMVGFLLAHALYKAALFMCAGAVLHATGVQSLRALGGMARHLPLTALSTTLASLSMAGLPPFFGFISKEFLFQAQIEGTVDWIPLFIAVLVNGVMVAVASVITLRPFFMGGPAPAIRHGETPGLVFGAVMLSLAGLLLSLSPDWITRNVLRPAAIAVYGTPVEVRIALWHGMTPMLLTSGCVVLIGGLIAFYWRPIHARLRARHGIDRLGPENAYERLLELTVAAGERIRGRGHGLRSMLVAVVGGMLLLAGWMAAAAGALPRFPGRGGIEAGPAAVMAAGAASALAAARARDPLAALLGVGGAGLAAAILFLLYGAPDLALTQFGVEALMTVVLVGLLAGMVRDRGGGRTPAAARTDLLLAIGGAVLLFLVLVDISAVPSPGTASRFFTENALSAAHGRNIVNVILVDFRALDTLGETVVIAMSALVVLLLAAGGSSAGAPLPAAPGARAIALVLGLVALWLLWRGHQQPGGGFAGGLAAGLAAAILAMAGPRRSPPWPPLAACGAGMLLMLLAGIPGLVGRAAFLAHPAPVGPLSTTLLFDTGVLLVVAGTIAAWLQRFAPKAAA